MHETEPSTEEFDSLSRVCRDLREPLEVIHSFADLLENGVSGALSEGQHDQVLTIKEAAARLSGMIRTLTGLTELELGRAELCPSLVELEELCLELHERWSPRFAGRGVRFDLIADSPLPALVEADRERLEGCLSQLLENGLKFTPPGGEVSVEVFAGAATTGVIVRDSGPGIPVDELQRIFDWHVRLEPAAPGVADRGAGVGLTLCRAGIEAMGGRVWAESKEGACFHVVFPSALVDPMGE